MLLNCSEDIHVLLSGFLYFLQMFTGMDSINVALNKRGEFCGKPANPIPLMFDGITNLETSIYYDIQCITPPHAFVIIHLDELFSIQYMVVYHGDNKEGQLNHFKGYFREGSSNTLCSEYPFKIPTSGQSMRMNCQPIAKLFSAFQFNGVHDIGFNVSEIELHTLATGLPENKNVLIYRGCFGKFGSRDEELVYDDIVNCQMKCLSEDKSFIGIKDNKFCACDDDFLNEELLPTKTCSVKCIDGVRYCGGPSSYSVYIVKPPLPWFVGCYPFTGSTFESPDKSMTVEKCLRKCDNHANAKLREGHFCICGDSVLPLTADRGWQCNTPCPGRPSEYCGSVGHEALYATCKNRSMTCSKLFQCDPESDYDMHGKCKRCKPGFIGEHCFEVEDPAMHSTTDNRSESIESKTTPRKFKQELEELKDYIAAASVGLLLTCLLCCLVCGDDDSEEGTSSS